MKRKLDIIKAIRIFLVVLEHHSFSEASNQLNLAISAVSKQVSDLEEHFGCSLLSRTTRAMHLTAEGKYFKIQFEDILNRLDGLIDSANERSKTIAGELSITTPTNLDGLGLSTILDEFMSEHPDVKISLRQLNRFVDIVDEGIDLAVRVGELSDSNLIARLYKTVDVHFVASPSYLKKHGTPKHPKELNQFDCVIELSTQKPWRWHYQEGNNNRWVNIKGRIEVNSADLTAKFAASGKGIARLPTFVIKNYLATGQLIPILQTYQTPALPVSLVYPANRITNPALKALINFILSKKAQV